MTRQLVFDLPHRAALGRDAFFVAPSNALALAALDDWTAWPDAKMLLVGPQASGKTHLVAVWAESSGARVVEASELDPDRLRSLSLAPVCVENADRISGQGVAEEKLFHLHNLMAATGMPLLITARTPPRDWHLGLPDLLSRLQAAALVRLAAPDDALLSAVLVKLFADRQLQVAPAVVNWLAVRMERSIDAAERIVAALDAQALSEGASISQPLVRRVFESLARDDRGAA